MSEKIYTRLFRLYPSRFRKAYEDEALQLIRDRLRDEAGFFKRARLWWDLAMDVFAGLPQAYRNSYAVTAEAPAAPNAEGIPSFRMLDNEPLKRGSILIGSTLSLATIAAFGFLLSRSIGYVPLSSSNGRISAIESVVERLNRATTPDTAAGRAEEAAKSPSAGASESQSWPAAALPESTKHQDFATSVNVPANGLTANIPIASRDANPNMNRDQSLIPLELPRLQNASGSTSLDAAARQRVVTSAIQNLRQHYFDREVAQETADALLAHEKNGDDDAAKDGVVFAELLTRQMRDKSHDMHLVMEYSRDILPEHPPEPTPESLARYRMAMEQQNCMFRKIEILSHDIGYLKLDSFPDTSVCRSTATAAMAALNHATAIIIDLRDNSGGFPGMVTLIAGYLFDHPQYMYSPKGAPTEEFWTHSPIPENTLADKPVYILTSASTWSGAEQFSYDLKMLKRATLVGETTRGGAHAGVFHRIDDHFGMGIPEQKAINPFGKTDWEGVGVEPDVKVSAAEALETAVKLAEARVGTK
jgi:hypothetical protein